MKNAALRAIMPKIKEMLDEGYDWNEILIGIKADLEAALPKTWAKYEQRIEEEGEREAFMNTFLQPLQYLYYSPKIKEFLTLDQVMDAAEREMFGTDNPGFCIACGGEHDSCEPDASFYECYDCGQHMVFAAAEILMRGMVS